jgi:hypothetical protein
MSPAESQAEASGQGDYSAGVFLLWPKDRT